MSKSFNDDERVAKRIAKQHDDDGVTDKACSKKIAELHEQVENARQVEAEAAMKLGESLIKIGTLEEQVEKLQEAVKQMQVVGTAHATPGASGFTMCVFNATDVPVGTGLCIRKDDKP